MPPADAPAVEVSRLRLPVYRLRLRKEPFYRRARFGGQHEQRWASSWETDESDLLGGERSVWTWLHAIRGKSPADATKLTVLYWSIRELGGCHPDRPFTLDEVPASRQFDVRRVETMFALLTDATWCAACRSAPMRLDAAQYPYLCAWCACAPIARVLEYRGGGD